MFQLNRFFVALAFFGLSVGANAQDLIVKHDGTSISGKVTEVNETTIKYEIDDVSYSIAKSEVLTVVIKPSSEDIPQNQQHTPQTAYSTNEQPLPAGYVPRYSKAIPEKRFTYQPNVFAIEIGAGYQGMDLNLFYQEFEIYNAKLPLKNHPEIFMLGLRYTHNFTPFFGIDFLGLKVNYNKYYSNINYLFGLRFTTREFGKKTSFYGAIHGGVGYGKWNTFAPENTKNIYNGRSDPYHEDEIYYGYNNDPELYKEQYKGKTGIDNDGNKFEYIDFFYFADFFKDKKYHRGKWLVKYKDAGFIYSADAEIGFNIARYFLLGFYVSFDLSPYNTYHYMGINRHSELSFGAKLGVNIGKTKEKIIPEKPARLLNPVTSYVNNSDKYKKNAFAFDNDFGGGSGVFTYAFSMGWLHNFGKYFGWDVIHFGSGVAKVKGFNAMWSGLNVTSGVRFYTPRFVSQMCGYVQSRFGYGYGTINTHLFVWNVGAGLQFTNNIYGGVIVNGSHHKGASVGGRIGFNF